MSDGGKRAAAREQGAGSDDDPQDLLDGRDALEHLRPSVVPQRAHALRAGDLADRRRGSPVNRQPLDLTDGEMLRETVEQFGLEVSRKFYDYEVPQKRTEKRSRAALTSSARVGTYIGPPQSPAVIAR